MTDQELPTKPNAAREVAISGSRDVDVVATTYVVAPDIAAVRQAFCDWPSWCGTGTPERAWENAVSGDTAARLRNGSEVTEWECTARIIATAAAYGWWPQERSGGEYIAVPIDHWVADGHSYTKIVPNLDAMLDRWNIAPVVIDAGHVPSAIEGSAGDHSPR
ncbi:hypothetical protein B5P44_00605 [Mycobacterium sp. CBMA 213]|uniref:Uncharacterized protein n=2 Tax=Mycolicibacterium sp. CBMA 213 TaxID=1968788 RepID=A0A343VRA5_9MYCO|nr:MULTISPECIES: hypothetical protein [unclassified Mycolicibacterium]AVN58429.1 hypothetical protein B5P44_p00134 [Mycolicibacterium sp. CBMA 213]MUL61087.1 hypothetical protein [Mycolicibacterium sp. CBMA 335]MUM03324.1 hypothetical protein [Mycolicibacterium sp. CBMA 213]